MASPDAQSTDHRRLLVLLIVVLIIGPLLCLAGMAFLTTVVAAVGPRPTPPDHGGVVDAAPAAHRVGRDAGVSDAGVSDAAPDAHRVEPDASVPDAGEPSTGPSFE